MELTNPRSYKQIVGVKLGEYVCSDHAHGSAPIKTTDMGICYACATLYHEPKREVLAKRAAR